jgi:uncharacterized protein
MYKNKNNFVDSYKRKKMIQNQKKRKSNEYFHHSPFRLKIDKSNIQEAGLGVFTLDFIPENTIIDEYVGNVIETMTPKYNRYYYELQSIDLEANIPSIGIDAMGLPRCFMAMLNDATFETNFETNCEFDENVETKKVYVASIRDIEPGEELFIEYGENYWNYYKKHPELLRI